MDTKPHTHGKVFEQRIVYRLVISNEAAQGEAKPYRVVCTYHNGQRIHGKHTPDQPLDQHPPIVVSAKDQDEILWIAAVPFEIVLELAPGELGPDNPFYRPLGPAPQNPWKASKGNDNTWRFATGPVNPLGLLAPSTEYKFSAYALDGNGKRKDDSEPLDPHVIIEP